MDGHGNTVRPDGHEERGGRPSETVRGIPCLSQQHLQREHMGGHHRRVPERERPGGMGGGQPEDDDDKQRELHRHHHRQEPRHLRLRRHGSAHLPTAGLLRHHLQHEQLEHQRRRMDELRDARHAPARHPRADACGSTGWQGEQALQRGQPERDHQHHGGQAVFCFQRWRYSAT